MNHVHSSSGGGDCALSCDGRAHFIGLPPDAVVIRPIKPGETRFEVAAPFAREGRGGAAIGFLDIIIVHAAVSLPNTSKRVLGSAAHQLTFV
jgi:hypothetical protein